MTIIDILDNMPKLDGTVESDYIHNGFVVPRVTKILQRCIHNDSFCYWANSLGFKHLSYKQELNKAAEIGTICHNNIDKYLTNYNENSNFSPALVNERASNAYQSFIKWFEDVSSIANFKILMHEETLTCPWFGGTLDGLYDFDGTVYVVDYKTSNHIGFSYFLQLAAYRYMLKLKGVKTDGFIILQLSKDKIAYDEYVIKFDNPEHLAFAEQCETTFLSLVYSYYNLAKTEWMFLENKQFKKGAIANG